MNKDLMTVDELAELAVKIAQESSKNATEILKEGKLMAIPTNIKTLLSGEVVEWARIDRADETICKRRSKRAWPAPVNREIPD